MVHEFCKLARIEPLPEDLEHAAGNGQRIHRKPGRQFLEDVIGKFLDVTILHRLSGHMPAFVVDATNQHRKLRAEMHRDFRRQPVA